VTALVNPNGYVERWLEPFREGFAVRNVELPNGSLTFYTRHGDWLGWASGLVVLGAFILRRRA
jgi:apolipoprotein N-acyltransferase